MLRIPLFELAASQRCQETKLTSRRMIRSLRTLTMRPIVAASSPWFIAGLAKSMLWPSRRRPLESSWLLMYSDAVRRFSVSIMLGWRFKTQIEHGHSRHRERADGFFEEPADSGVDGAYRWRRCDFVWVGCYVGESKQAAVG